MSKFNLYELNPGHQAIAAAEQFADTLTTPAALRLITRNEVSFDPTPFTLPQGFETRFSLEQTNEKTYRLDTCLPFSAYVDTLSMKFTLPMLDEDGFRHRSAVRVDQVQRLCQPEQASAATYGLTAASVVSATAEAFTALKGLSRGNPLHSSLRWQWGARTDAS